MLYSEFVENTGCKQSEKNYEVYKNLEVLYNNSDVSKELIYEYGRKLVDNSPSEKELEIIDKIKSEYAELKERYADYKRVYKLYGDAYDKKEKECCYRQMKLMREMFPNILK